MTDDVPIRDAAIAVVVRDRRTAPKVLMGQRGKGAVFMPSKFVFPGGAVDPTDGDQPFSAPLPEPCRERLSHESSRSPEAVAAAAIRELWEETGQMIGAPGDMPATPGWEGFAEKNQRPDASALQFIFRAITPPGRPRRFDARFFLVEADKLTTDLDQLDSHDNELSHLQWVPLTEAHNFDLPFVTQVVMDRLKETLADTSPPSNIPFFRNEDEGDRYQWLLPSD